MAENWNTDNGSVVVNSVMLIGKPAEEAKFSHSSGTERYMSFPLEIERLSGALDRINIIARDIEIDSLGVPLTESRVFLDGEVRSFNNRSTENAARLVITVLAKELRLAADDEGDRNDVRLTGVICKTPTLRQTPMGRQICDIMLAVNRRFGRSNYLPCIAWGKVAAEIAIRAVGDTVSLVGRIQSRKYIKYTEQGSEERVAFEVSVVSLDEDDKPPVLDPVFEPKIYTYEIPRQYSAQDSEQPDGTEQPEQSE
ncbi:MAG: single-stranded DNA-binding protein [Oscillospiraceae bacterium]|nr:single-stranded DNA-binding protein [Oscillospiraceae bacterium]